MANGSSIDSCPWRRVEAVFLGMLLFAPLVFDPWDGPCPVSQYKFAYILLISCLLVTAFCCRPLFRCGFRFTPSLIDLPGGLFLFLAGISIFWAVNVPVHQQRFALLLAAAACFLILRIRTVEGDRPAFWLAFLLLAGTVTALVDGAAFLYVRLQGTGGGGAGTAEEFKAATLLFTHNNVASVYAVLLPPMAVALVLYTRRRMGRILAAAALAVIVVYLILLESRAALFETVLGVLLVVLCTAWRKKLAAVLRWLSRILRKRSVLLLLALLLLAVFLLPLSREFSSVAKAGFSRAVELLDLQYERAYFRLDIWRKTMAMVGDHFFFGVGLGNFPVAFPAYHKRDLPKAHAHNEYFHILAELGVFGLLLYLLFLLLLFRAFVNAFLHGEERERTLLLGLAGAIFVELIHGLVEPPLLFESSSLTLAGCFGLVCGLEGRVLPGRIRAFGPWKGIGRFLPPALAAAGLVFVLPGILGLFRQGILLERANAAMARAKFLEAERLYRQVAALGWDSYVSHLNIGRAAFRARRFEEALREFKKAQALYPNFYMLYFDEGLTLLRLGRPRESVRVLDRCLELNPRFARAKIYRIQAQVEMGMFEAAYRALEGYLRSRRPTAAEFKFAGDLFYRGSIHPRRGRTLRAQDLKRALVCWNRCLEMGGGTAFPELARFKESQEIRLRTLSASKHR